MTTKLTIKRFRTGRPNPATPTDAGVAAEAAQPGTTASPAGRAHSPDYDPEPFGESEDGFGAAPFATARGEGAGSIPANTPAVSAEEEAANEAIRAEGLTGRQLRNARRLALRHGIDAVSDYDAVRRLRLAGIDPMQRASVLELIRGGISAAAGAGANETSDRATNPLARSAPPGKDAERPSLPQTFKPINVPSTEQRAEQSHLSELRRIQLDIARRRRRQLAFLGLRLAFFVGLPTLIAGVYFSFIAAPLYATKTEFVIQQAAIPGATATGGGMLGGSLFATAQDSMAMQGYLMSRDAMIRLDREQGFRAHFSAPSLDFLNRLPPEATDEELYRTYARNVKIAYDPTEGIIKMEVVAADPQVSVTWSQALISYAEEQVDQLTQRMREDQMKGARESYQDAEAKLTEAQRHLVELQESFKMLSSETEVGLITGRISELEGQLTKDNLTLIEMQSNASPNAARMEPLKRRIATLEEQIVVLRAKLTEGDVNGMSLAQIQSELLVAQADVETRQMMMSTALQQMEVARIEANRQTRYLSLSVSPVAPDEATYPAVFSNTMVTLLIFLGIYLVISMTVAILREQVTA